MSNSKPAAESRSTVSAILQNYTERLKTRMQELIGTQLDPDRILQEAALLVDRSDIQEELVRLDTHVQHFLGLLDRRRRSRQETGFPAAGDEPRSQYAAVENFGPCGRSLKITEARTGHEIGDRKVREQVQNIE